MAGETAPNFWSAQTGYTTITTPVHMVGVSAPPYQTIWVPVNANGIAAPAHSQAVMILSQSGPSQPVPMPVQAVYNVVQPSTKPKKTVKIAEDTKQPPGAKKMSLMPGSQYLYPDKHVNIHCTKVKLWQESGSQFEFEIFKVSTSFTVKDLIERLGGGKGFAVTECVERGNGNWDKGMTVKYDDADKAKSTLSKLGWSEKRGAEQEPLWIVLWKCE